MLDREWQELAANGVIHEARSAGIAVHACAADVAQAQMRPSVLYRPAISLDGDKWCALYGDNPQDGVAGFGDSPADAMADFDKNWNKP